MVAEFNALNARTTDATLHSERHGEGPLLVMLHGLFGSLDNFGAVAKLFADEFSVLRLDLPGHGRSPSLPTLSYPSMAEAVLHTLDELDVDRCHLLGHSMGGKVAMAIAGDPGDLQLERLIIVDIAPRDYPPHHDEILEALQGIDTGALTKRGDADEALRAGVEDAGVRAFLLKNLYRHDEGGFRWRFDLEALVRDYSRLAEAPPMQRQVDVPTLFVKGGESDYLQRRDEPRIRECFSDPQLKTMQGCGHWPHAEKPDIFARFCSEFLLAE